MIALNPEQLWWVAGLHLKVSCLTDFNNLILPPARVLSRQTALPLRLYNGINGEKIATALATMSHLANPLATPSQLYQRASASSLPPDLNEAIFITTQCLTQAAGRLLQLPQSVTAQASVLLARYWVVDSPMAHEFSVGSISIG